MLTIADVQDLVEHDEVPLKYLSMRMGQRPFWKLYAECNPGMKSQDVSITSFVCPPGITINLDRTFGREGYTMDVADEYYVEREIEEAKGMNDFAQPSSTAEPATPEAPKKGCSFTMVLLAVAILAWVAIGFAKACN